MRELNFYGTWSSGMALWNTDMLKIPHDLVYNELFPHTNILFHQRKAKYYIIDNRSLWHEQQQGKHPKGSYNVFYAFAVEYPYILLGLMRDGDLKKDDFFDIMNGVQTFIANLYIDYIVLRRYCSYDLTDYEKNIRVFFTKEGIRKRVLAQMIKRCIEKLKIYNNAR